MTRTLHADQRWLVEAITSRRRPRAIAKHLGGAAVPERVGLDIHRHAYRARLVECLEDDFPTLKALLGADVFARLAQAAIAAGPSRDVTLNRYSRRLVTHLRSDPAQTRHGRLAVDLARFEWAMVEAIHAPLVPGLSAAVVAQVPGEAWAEARLVAVPTLRLVASRWQIAEAFRQHQRGETVTEPAETPGLSAILRSADGLRHQVFTPAEGRLLGSLVRGRMLGEALTTARLAPDRISAVFARFIAAGCFSRIITPSAEFP